jgi:membrane fusion protein (multidrug efflux system)
MTSPRPHLRALSAACLLTVSLTLTLSGCGKADGQQAAPPATEVGVVTLSSAPLTLHTELPGRTTAVQSADIRPQVAGIIQARLFQEGAVVKAGQVLYQIDPASYTATVRSDQAAVAKAQAAVNAARLAYNRQKALQDAGVGTTQDLEDAQSTLQQDEASLQAAQADLASAQLDLNRTQLRSPITGRVDTSTVTAGALVTAAQTTALTTVTQVDPIMVDIPQSSVDVLRLRQQISAGKLKDGAMAIHLVLEDGSTYAHAGKLKVSGATVSETTGAVTLRAEVPNPDGLLLPGMYVRAVIDQAQDPTAILVPQAGVTRNTHGDATALLVGADGKVSQQVIEVGEAVSGQWRVLSGLKAGDRVIVQGQNKVNVGQVVHAVAVSAAASAPAASTSAASAAQQ